MTDSLYGTRNPTKTKHKPTSSNSAFSFSSNLSSLIAASKSKTSSNPTQASKLKSKPDIFTTHNRNVTKRKLADLQEHQTKHDLDPTSQSDLHRSKRRMEEKARLYNAMKRGEYIPSTHSKTSHHDTSLVDFDRKWAESQPPGSHSPSASDQSSSSDSDPETTPAERVTWTDEFGRLRHGSSKQKSRYLAQQSARLAAETESAEMHARPSQPSTLIYGDTIQHQAFNPDAAIESKMAELAAKRDRSATPPPDTHFDASWEIRNRGTGFYAFSSDAEGRKAEQDALAEQREETEKARQDAGEKKKAREDVREKRRREIEERRMKINQTRNKRETDRFLDSLDILDVTEDGELDKIGTDSDPR